MRKVISIVVGSVATGAIIAGLGIVAWREYQAQQAPETSSATSKTIGLSLAPATASTSVPIDVTGSGSSAIALSGSSSAPSSNQATTPQSNSVDASQGASSTSNARAATLDPSKFTEYDQYKSSQNALFGDIVVGSGDAVAVGKSVTVNYRGWLTTGQEFDESYSKGKPFTFVMGQHKVIIGWEEGLSNMKVGGKRLLIVPPAVGYGNQTTNGIPANSVLVFEVELLAVQ